MSVPRELLKWVLSLDLSYPVKNVRREFANGFLFAEVLSRYFPADVHMHSFENVSSTERKKSNWTLLTKLFKKKGIPIEKKQIDAAMAAEGEAAVELLQQLHDFVTSSAYVESDQQYEDPSPLPRLVLKCLSLEHIFVIGEILL
ncbi:hypothetical protein DUNSADRAFT_8367 [Dunaliella salina]|uniref:Calponin-homology (CH) domain-containing protein n=1 Tax=Dunaliella salina TaxID=3046 RepID=A0ABQ7FSW9_DUNSA|nr:hypothetical protein DUNSADRAFT_8367 [Dunaliella salina]|eukprot:KAF5825585.1 hypothetical protein DUNSADRAFT_8367 [Dunaliella salina]